MAKTFMVDLESGLQYEVMADYTIHHNKDTIGCSLNVVSVRPTLRVDTALTDQVMSEIESALAYKIVDEYNDGDIEDTSIGSEMEEEEYLC